MSNRVFQVLPLATSFRWELTEGQYRYNKHGRLPWLQKLLFWVLSKLKCNDLNTFIVDDRPIIHMDDMVRAILENQHAATWMTNYSQTFKPKYILMGRDQALKFGKDLNNYGPFVVKTTDFRYDGMFLEMDIIVIPWMDGLVVLPELDRL